MALGNDSLWLDPFAYRQFDDAAYSGTKIGGVTKEAFMAHVCAYYEERVGMEKEFPDRPVLVDGYAPFCKHIFIPNTIPGAEILQGELEITPGNIGKLRSSYEARNADEIPVLTRYFPRERIEVPRAKYLDLIRTYIHLHPTNVKYH